MNRILTALALILTFAVGATAQKPSPSYPRPTWGIERHPDHSMSEMVDARKKLIDRYVLQDHYAWGVSVCGDDDVLTGEPNSWLTIYLYSDSLKDFAVDFDQFATRVGNGTLTVDGITVVVEVIKRPTKGAHNGTPERNDRQPEHQNGRGNAAVSGRTSRA